MTTAETPMFRDEFHREFDALVARYPDPRSALLPLLHRIQSEKGWISPDAMRWAAARLDLSPAHVEGVVSFYSMFFTRPMGRHVIQLCRTLSCDLRGARSLRAALKERLGLSTGQTSADGSFSLIEVECLGACGTAPAMMIDDILYEDLSPEKLAAILESLEA